MHKFQVSRWTFWNFANFWRKIFSLNFILGYQVIKITTKLYWYSYHSDICLELYLPKNIFRKWNFSCKFELPSPRLQKAKIITLLFAVMTCPYLTDHFTYLLVPFGYLFGLPKNYFREVEFSCKFELPSPRLQEAKIITLLFAVMTCP